MLALRSRPADRRAFDLLLREHDPDLRAVCWRFLGPALPLEDTLIDAYAKAYRWQDQLDGDGGRSAARNLELIVARACLHRLKRAGDTFGWSRPLPRLDPPPPDDAFWERVDRRLDEVDEGRESPATRLVALVSRLAYRDLWAPAAIAALVAAVGVGWVVMTQFDESPTTTTMAVSTPTSGDSASGAGDRPGQTPQIGGDTDAGDGPGDGEPVGDSASGDSDTATSSNARSTTTTGSTTTTQPGDTPPGSGGAPDDACVTPPLGVFGWESIDFDTGPNDFDEAIIRIEVVDDGDPCQVSVSAFVDLGRAPDDDDAIFRPYVRLGEETRLIYNGLLVGEEISGADEYVPYTATLVFDKPSTSESWVVGYENYVDISHPEETGQGSEESPPLS